MTISAQALIAAVPKATAAKNRRGDNEAETVLTIKAEHADHFHKGELQAHVNTFKRNGKLFTTVNLRVKQVFQGYVSYGSSIHLDGRGPAGFRSVASDKRATAKAIEMQHAEVIASPGFHAWLHNTLDHFNNGGAL